MAQPYVGEIRMFCGNFAPAGWMMCEGQILPISEWDTMFNLIGTTYGGDGQSTFALPDLRGRVPLHFGSGFIQAETGGAESVNLTVPQLPNHGHPLLACSGAGDQITPGGNVPASSFNVTPYINDVPNGSFNASSISSIGGSQPHTNFQPYLCVNFIISMFGIFPPPS